MSRISKELAKDISIKLTEKSRIAAEEIKKEYQSAVTEAYWSQTPKEITEQYKKYPDWFYTRRSISLNGHGFHWESVSADVNVICNNTSSANLELTPKLASKLIEIKRRYEKANENYKKLKLETETALLNLKTHNQIKENFPLAAPFLPPPMSNSLVCNFDELEKRLKKQPSLTKEKV